MQAATQLWVSTCLLVVLFAVAYGNDYNYQCNQGETHYKRNPFQPCTQYLSCTNGKFTVVKCLQGTVLNDDGFCDDPDNVPNCVNGKYKPSIKGQQGYEFKQPPPQDQCNEISGNTIYGIQCNGIDTCRNIFKWMV